MPKQLLSAYINQALNIVLLVVVALIPLFFAPFTTEYFETPKLILLIGAVLLLLVLLSLSWVLGGKVLITRTPLDLPLVLLLGIILISTFFSDTRYISIVGNLPRVYGSAASWVSLILLYFIATSTVKTKQQVQNLLYTLIISSLVVALIALASYFGLFLPLPFAKFPGFNTAGSSFSVTALLAVLLPIPVLSMITPNKYMPRAIAILIASIFILTIVLLGSPVIYIASGIGIILTFLTQRHSLEQQKNKYLNPNPAPAVVESFVFAQGQQGKKTGFKNLGVLGKVFSWAVLIVPILVLLIILASFIPTGKVNNPFSAARTNFNNFRDLQLSFSSSWKISVSSFRDNPFLGTGPATYLFDFTRYKPIEFNQTKMWNLKFDQGFNEFLQILATLGGLGLLAFVFFAAMVLTFALKNIISPKDKEDTLALGLSICGLVALVILAVHTASLVVMVGILVILAMMMNVNKSTGKVEEVSIGIKTSRYADSQLVTGDALPLILFVPIIICVIAVAWNSIPIIKADYYHRQAITLVNTKPIEAYRYLIEARNTNPLVDSYRINLANTDFAIANAIATTKGPTEASPAGSLTDNDKKDIQALLAESISEGRAAVTLSPKNAGNWEILGSIYRQIAGVAENALQFSLDAYGRAIDNDPLNPSLRLSVGGIYYSIKNYDLAIRFFTDAITLKPDYANSYYNLAIALKDKGDLVNGQAAAERTVALLEPNSADYKVASELLANLKNANQASAAAAQKNQTTSGGGGTITSPDQPSALQNLPDVKLQELQDQPQVATPPAVKR